MLEFWPKYPLLGTNDILFGLPIQPLYRHIQVKEQYRQVGHQVEHACHPMKITFTFDVKKDRFFRLGLKNLPDFVIRDQQQRRWLAEP